MFMIPEVVFDKNSVVFMRFLYISIKESPKLLGTPQCYGNTDKTVA